MGKKREKQISGTAQCCGAGPFLTGSGSSFFFWPALAPAPALVKKYRYALKKLKKMNNSRYPVHPAEERIPTSLRISFLFVHVRTQEQKRVQSVWNKNNFKKVKLYLQYQYLQVVSSVNFWGTFLKFNFSSMVEPGSGRLRNTGYRYLLYVS